MKLRVKHVAAVLALFVLARVGDGARYVQRSAPEVAEGTEAQQAERRAAAKAAARKGVIADIYEEWQAASAEHELRYSEMLAAAVERSRTGADDPVRSLDEARSAQDPAGGDPALRAYVDAWESTCADYERRLRALGSDPLTDPRSPR